MASAKKYITETATGPNRFSNWVVYPDILLPGRILMSEYPYRSQSSFGAHRHPVKTDYLKQLRAFPRGVTYICLQEKTELSRLDLPIYHSTAGLKKDTHLAKIRHIGFDNGLEIPDVNVTDDDRVYEYVLGLYDLYIKGENLVIHCLGGHGRTGTIAGLLLGIILVNNSIIIKSDELLQLIKLCHDQRKERNGWIECPQTNSQKSQVVKLYKRFLHEKNVERPRPPEMLETVEIKQEKYPRRFTLADYFRCYKKKSKKDTPKTPKKDKPKTLKSQSLDIAK